MRENSGILFALNQSLLMFIELIINSIYTIYYCIQFDLVLKSIHALHTLAFIIKVIEFHY